MVYTAVYTMPSQQFASLLSHPVSLQIQTASSPQVARLCSRNALNTTRIPVHSSSATSAALRSSFLSTPNSACLPRNLQTVQTFWFSWRKGFSKRQSPKRAFSCSAVVADVSSAPMNEIDANGVERLLYQEKGYTSWEWQGHKINYVSAGQESKPAILLVHGFGASVYHWRYNIPALSKKFRVYAIDLLGFGWSDKAIVPYNAGLWREQLSDFLREIVKKPAVLVGNSVGGYAVLNTAVAFPELVTGLVLVNAAGSFDQPSEPGVAVAPLAADTPALGPRGGARELLKRLVDPLKRAAQRVVLQLTFLQAKQPARIRQVLRSVYPDSTNVDDALVESIVKPSQDPNASEVYYRLTSQVLLDRASSSLTALLANLQVPMLLLWGELDPWMTPSKAAKISALYPSATYKGLRAGHCPHDEAPEAVNAALEEWVSNL
eukprot:TRINITY_DN153_c0_g1_i3.p1 TRINITY_DN153_c0_g1~~TRINITY_DN153_c0_g1_i3.p1  ORF type:complete len:434 (+),score=47.48 TRINITY_DN153_c0_g1_i3:163-1464(+)